MLIALPGGRVAADEALVQQLIAAQFPHWRHLPVRAVASNGWDNRSFRLGDGMLVRMPTASHYAGQVAREQRWLPILAPHLPVPIPQPLAQGMPALGFPWPWSVYGWIDGEAATADSLGDDAAFVTDLAGFLRMLWQIGTNNGPAPGKGNFHRGGDLAVYDAQTKAAIASLGTAIDPVAVRHVWTMALASRWRGPACWLHGDVAPGNLLMRGCRLAAVIDFGCMAVGDPACDLAIGWTCFDAPTRRLFQTALGVDDATMLRAAGWALWKALITLAAPDGTDGVRQMAIIEAIVSAHAC